MCECSLIPKLYCSCLAFFAHRPLILLYLQKKKLCSRARERGYVEWCLADVHVCHFILQEREAQFEEAVAEGGEPVVSELLTVQSIAILVLACWLVTHAHTHTHTHAHAHTHTHTHTDPW